MDEKIKITEEKRQALLSELQQTLEDGMKFANALVAFNDGTITKEDFANIFEEIITEVADKKDRRACEKSLIRIIERLLLLKYGIDAMAQPHLKHEIFDFQMDVISDLDWDTKEPETRMINTIIERLPITYVRSIRDYEEDDEANSKMKAILNSLPVDCPWSLDELLDASIETLIGKLPEIT
jgi:hypothetical protein